MFTRKVMEIRKSIPSASSNVFHYFRYFYDEFCNKSVCNPTLVKLKTWQIEDRQTPIGDTKQKLRPSTNISQYLKITTNLWIWTDINKYTQIISHIIKIWTDKKQKSINWKKYQHKAPHMNKYGATKYQHL